MIKKKWTNARLSRKQICFLDKLSKACKFSGGKTLSRSVIMRAFLTVVKESKIDVNNVKTEKELKQRVLTTFKKEE